MKTILLTIIACCTMLLGTHAQELHVQPSEDSSFFKKAWQMQYSLVNGQQMRQGTDVAKVTFGFKSDRMFIVRGSDGSDVIGEWTYYFDKKYIDLVANDKIVARVKSFTPDLVIMTIVPPNGNEDPRGVVEMHFKPL